MKCSEHEDLAAFLDGELDERRAGEIRAHIESCRQCRRAAELLKRSWDALEYVEAAEPPAGFVRRVMSRTRRRSLVPLSAAAGALVTAGILYLALSVGGNGEMVELARLSEEERGVIENMEILENYDLLSDLDLLAQYETIEEFEEFPEVDLLYENGRQT